MLAAGKAMANEVRALNAINALNVAVLRTSLSTLVRVGPYSVLATALISAPPNAPIEGPLTSSKLLLGSSDGAHTIEDGHGHPDVMAAVANIQRAYALGGRADVRRMAVDVEVKIAETDGTMSVGFFSNG